MKSYEEYLKDVKQYVPDADEDVCRKIYDAMVLSEVQRQDGKAWHSNKPTKKFCVTLTVEAESAEELLDTPIVIKMLNGKEYTL